MHLKPLGQIFCLTIFEHGSDSALIPGASLADAAILPQPQDAFPVAPKLVSLHGNARLYLATNLSTTRTSSAALMLWRNDMLRTFFAAQLSHCILTYSSQMLMTGFVSPRPRTTSAIIVQIATCVMRNNGMKWRSLFLLRGDSIWW